MTQDLMSKDGARHLARKIERHPLNRGKMTCEVVEQRHGKDVIYVVRSVQPVTWGK